MISISQSGSRGALWRTHDDTEESDISRGNARHDANKENHRGNVTRDCMGGVESAANPHAYLFMKTFHSHEMHLRVRGDIPPTWFGVLSPLIGPGWDQVASYLVSMGLKRLQQYHDIPKLGGKWKKIKLHTHPGDLNLVYPIFPGIHLRVSSVLGSRPPRLSLNHPTSTNTLYFLCHSNA